MTETRPRYESDESGVMRMLREFLDHHKFADVYELPPVLHFEQEYSLTRGRCDFVVFHSDGSVTVVEAKGSRELRNAAGGIGQLLSYTIQIGMARPGAVVRGLLVAPVAPGTEEARLLDEACRRAGMAFEPCPLMADLSKTAAAIIAKAAELG